MVNLIYAGEADAEHCLLAPVEADQVEGASMQADSGRSEKGDIQNVASDQPHV